MQKPLQSTPNSNTTRGWTLWFGNRRPFVDSRRRLFEITTRVCDGHHEARHSGAGVIWLPKYHCECNPIELVWGALNKKLRQICDYKLPFLRVDEVPCCLGTELGLTRQYFRKARDYVRANASVPVPTAGAIDEEVAEVKLERRYASHRRPAPIEYQ